MARPSIVGACAVVALAAATPSLANSPADASRCGAKLVAGWARCIDWVMKISEHRSLEAKALKGDNEAAWKLAGFHLMANEEAIAARWLRLAAQRGDCAAMGEMLNRARGAEAAKWEAHLRAAKCRD